MTKATQYNTTTDLWPQWWQLVEPFGATEPVAKEVFADLTGRYGENGRFYHTLTHLEETFLVANSLRHLAHQWTVIQLAIWFHDAIYNPRAGDNEEQSATYAAQVLPQLRVSWQEISAVQQLILLTKTHQTSETDNDGHVLLDADLAILAAPPTRYNEYARAIRQEYQFVPDNTYRHARLQVLKRFLERPFIFHTPPMQETAETAARHNIHQEMERLGTTISNF